MSFGMNNTTGRQQPLGDRPLNYYVASRGGVDHDSGSGLKMPSANRTEMCSNPHIVSSHLQHSSSSNKNRNHTPNHRRTPGERVNAPFKSPISLCFDRMLGAGKFVERIVTYSSKLSFSLSIYTCSRLTLIRLLIFSSSWQKKTNISRSDCHSASSRTKKAKDSLSQSWRLRPSLHRHPL